MYTRVCAVSWNWNTFKLHSHTKLNLIIPTTTLPFSFTVTKQHQINLKCLSSMLHVHLSFCSSLSLKYIQTTLPHEIKPVHSNHHPAFQFQSQKFNIPRAARNTVRRFAKLFTGFCGYLQLINCLPHANLWALCYVSWSLALKFSANLPWCAVSSARAVCTPPEREYIKHKQKFNLKLFEQ